MQWNSKISRNAESFQENWEIWINFQYFLGLKKKKIKTFPGFPGIIGHVVTLLNVDSQPFLWHIKQVKAVIRIISPDIRTAFDARLNGTSKTRINVRWRKLHKMHQGSNSLKITSGNSNYVRNSIQFFKIMIFLASQKITFY